MLGCVAACALGTVAGYLLNWAVRHNPKPNAGEVVLLVGAVTGGTIIARVQSLVGCPDALAWYLVGLAVGFFVYTAALWLRLERLRRQVATISHPDRR